MKKLSYILSLLAIVCSFFACKPTEQNPVGPQESISLRSTSVAEGATVDTSLTLITLEYSKVVVVSENANITLNGEKVVASKNPTTGMKVDIAISLKAETEYTLEVPSGSIVLKDDANQTAAALTLHFTTTPAERPVADNEAMDFLRTFGWGWNLGNHFDSFDGNNADANYKITYNKACPYWDGVRPTESLYTNLAAMGCGIVRMPVTWGPYQDMTDGNYTIDAAYMAEVKQNVDWALAHGLKVLLNTHHDEYWQDVVTCATNNILNETAEDRIRKTWTQIAEAFKDYDDALMFETFNELHDEAWGWASRNYTSVYAMMEEWNQIAVDAIRATGSKNADRWIGVPGFCAAPAFTCGQKHLLVLPNDPAGHIMVAVHTYDPYNFCTEGTVQQWGHGVNASGNDEKQVRDLFETMKKAFLDKNVPIYLGEYGVVQRKSAADEKFRSYYLEYLCRASYVYGIPVMLWDNNATSGEVFHYINHQNGAFYEEELVRLQIKANTSTDPNYTLESIYSKAPTK